jgi:hypothetical protein
MSDRTPNLVALYFWGSGEAVHVAEFRLNRDGQAVLTLIDPAGGRLAKEWHDHGIEFVAEGRTVLPSDGPAFMRALLQPFRMTYYHFVDESEHPDDAS